MGTYNYTLETFISTPTSEDKKIKIFDQYGVLKYTFDPNLSYFYYKNNYVFIKVENSDDITLDFETNSIAISALEKLNTAKKVIVAQATADITYYTKTELNAGQLNNIYYTSAQTDAIVSDIEGAYSPTGHSHYVTGLTDVNVTNLQDSEVLVYSNGEWVNSSFTFDTSAFTSNYYTIEQLSSDTSGVDINWNNIIETPTTLSGYGITDGVSLSNVYTKGELSGATSAEGDGALDERYYTKIASDIRYYTQDQSDANFLSASTEIYTSGEANDNFLSANTSYYTQDQVDANFLSANTTLYTQVEAESSFLSASTEIYTSSEANANFLSASTQIYTQTEINDLLINYAQTGLSVTFDSHTATTNEDHQIGFSDLVTTAHTHDDRYFTESELLNGSLDSRYYTSIASDGRYYEKSSLYTSGETDANFLSANTSYYTQDQADANFLSANTTLYTQSEAESSFLSATTEIYTKTEADSSFLSASTEVLTQNETDLLYIALAGSTGITGDLTPSIDGGASLGSLTRQWKELFVSGGTIYIGGVSVSVINGQLVVDGQIMATTASTANNYSLTSHTHSDLYFTKDELSGSTGVLDNKYYSKPAADLKFYEKTELYTSAQTDSLFDPYYTSAQTDSLFDPYYTSAQTDENFLSANTTLYTQIEAESSFLSANTVLYEKTDAENSFLSANTFDSVIETNGIDNTGGLTSTTFYGELDYSYLTNTSHTHTWSDIVNTSHTHDDRYYTETEIDPVPGDDTGSGILDTRYYTKTAADLEFYPKTELYTSGETDALFNLYYTSAQTDVNFLSADTSFFTQQEVTDNFLSANTSYYTQDQADANFISASTSVYSRDDAESSFLSANTSFYTQSQVNTLLTTYALDGDLTAHTSLTGSSNPHLISFDDLTLTSHTHDDRYYTKGELSGTSNAQGDGVLDDRYYTKYLIDGNFYTSAQVDDLLSALTFSGASGAFYTKPAIDAFLSGKSDIDHTHPLSGLSDILFTSLSDSDILAYSAATDTWYNATLAELSIDLSAYYTSAQTDILLNTKSNTSHTHSQYSLTSHTHDLSALTNTSHTHLWSDIVNTSHTHSQYIEAGTTSLSNYYLKTETDSYYVLISTLATNYYTSAETIALLDPYYTSAQTDTILLGYSETGHSHYITGLTDVTTGVITFGDVLVYSAGTWVNSSITMDLSNYYTQGEIDSIISGITTSTGASSLISLDDVTLSSLVTGDALVYNGSIWVNSAITADLSNYYTMIETAANFISANTTLFASSSHTHTLSAMTDVISGDTVTDGQFLQYNASLSGWTPATSEGLLGNFLPLSGGTMTGSLSFDFMTGNTAQTHRVLEVTTGGTVVEGDEVINLYITDTSLIDFITTGDTVSATTYWSGRTFVNPGLSAFTLYEGQKYIDDNYFYEYFDGILYRTYYADKVHTHSDLYYTEWELNPTGLTAGVLDDRYMSIDTLSTITLISLADVYDMIPGTYDDNFLRYDAVSGWTGYYINLSGIAYKDEVVLTGTTVTGGSGLTGGGTLDNDVIIGHLTAGTSVTANPTQTPTTIVQNINYDDYGHVTSYETSDFSSYWVRYIGDAQDVNVTSLSDFTDPYLFYDITTSKWIPTGLTMDRIDGLSTELNLYVRKNGETSQTIQGNIDISQELYVGSDLYVVGDTRTTGLDISDKIIRLNSGGTLTTNDRIGFRFDRQGVPLSQKNDFYLVYDEGSSHVNSGGTLKAGVLSDLKTLMTTTSTPIVGAVPFWYKPSGKPGYYENTNRLKWLSGTTTLQIDGDISGGFDNTGYTYSGLTTLRDVVKSIDISQSKEENSGFDVWNSSGTYYSIASNSSFTLLIGGYGFIKGRRIEFNSGQTIELTANKTNYIYIDSTGTIQKTTNDSVGTIYKDGIVLFEALYDGTETVVVKENHPYAFDTDVSSYLHRNVGVIIQGIGAIIGVVSTDTGSTDSQGVKITGTDVLEDHGIQTTITDSSSSGVSWNTYYTNALGQWIKYSGDTSLPNLYNSGGTPTAITSGDYVIYTLYVSKDDINSSSPRYFAVMDSNQYGSSSSAVTAISDGLTSFATNELSSLEFAQLGYAIIHNNGTTHYVDSVIVEKSSFNTKLIGGNVVNHLILDGLSDGQYGDGGHTNLVTKTSQSSDPTVNDDITSYKTGSIWINSVDNDVFINVDNTNGAAVWKEVASAPSANDTQVLFMSGTTITGSSNLTFDDSILSVGVDIIPDGDGIRNLGDSSHQWKDIYVSGGTIYLENVPLSTDGTDIYWSGNTLSNQTLQTVLDAGSSANITDDDTIFIEATKTDGSDEYLTVFYYNAEDGLDINAQYSNGTVGTNHGISMSGNRLLLYSFAGQIIAATEGGGSGITYGNDYSSNFVDRSLVDKAYVDGVASTAAGSHTEIQVNSGGSFATDSDFTYDFDSSSLTLASGRTGTYGLYSMAIGKDIINSGNYSFVTGDSNTANGLNSSILGGTGNLVDSDNTVNIGGTNNTIASHSDNSICIGGQGNTIEADNSCIIGGTSQTLSVTDTVMVPNLIVNNTLTINDIYAGGGLTINPDGDDIIIQGYTEVVGSFNAAAISSYSGINLNGRLEFGNDGSEIRMKSPNGTVYKITVDDSGNLVTTAV